MNKELSKEETVQLWLEGELQLTDSELKVVPNFRGPNANLARSEWIRSNRAEIMQSAFPEGATVDDQFRFIMNELSRSKPSSNSNGCLSALAKIFVGRPINK